MMVDYTKCFSHADDVIRHLNNVVHDTHDPLDLLLVQKYVGFVSVVAVTVYELAIKDIFVGFATKQHREFGNFVEASLARINGRIQLDQIIGYHIPKFGQEYRSRFEKNIEKKSGEYLRANRRNIEEAYRTVINARNTFVHAGNIQSQVTYDEIVKAYEDGKEVIHCLAETMVRQK